jgi:hypothetical protein
LPNSIAGDLNEHSAAIISIVRISENSTKFNAKRIPGKNQSIAGISE